MANFTVPSHEGFRRDVHGRPTDLYTITSPDDSCLCAITNYGARIVCLAVPDRAGHLTDVALGYLTLDEYLTGPEGYMGAIVGRCANRIAAGLFVLNGETHVLPVNDVPNTLHGGPGGLHARVWELAAHSAQSLMLRYTAADGEEGFPGTLDVEVQYSWKDARTLRIDYSAKTDKATLVNLSNHAYFNLSGEGADTILDHELHIAATAITPVDSSLIPTGRLTLTAGTAFDFIKPGAIGQRIEDADTQLHFGKGYDHNFVLSSGAPAVALRSPATGIGMTISTDRPGMQFYSGNSLDGSKQGKSGRPYLHRSAVVLEPQGFPDAIHHPQFPSVVLKPADHYRSASEYTFSAI